MVRLSTTVGGIALVMSGCGFLADSISEELTFDFESDVIEPTSIDEGQIDPVSFTVAADETTPSYSSPEFGTEGISAVLFADTLQTSPDFRIEATNFFFESDEPIRFDVTVSSLDDIYLGNIDQRRDLGFVPTQPSSCSFELDPATDGATEYGDNMTTCVRDFVEANGAPLALSYTVDTSFASNERVEGEYTVSHLETMRSEVEVSTGSRVRFLDDIDEDALANFGSINFTELGLAGFGYSTETVDLYGYVAIWDAQGRLRATAELAQRINGGEFYWIFNRLTERPDGSESFVEAGTVNPPRSPASPEFEEQVLLAARSQLDAPEDSFGAYAQARWIVKGAFPRNGAIGVVFQGRAEADFSGDNDPPDEDEFIYYDPSNGEFELR